jgi:hypothetical protein
MSPVRADPKNCRFLPQCSQGAGRNFSNLSKYTYATARIFISIAIALKVRLENKRAAAEYFHSPFVPPRKRKGKNP